MNGVRSAGGTLIAVDGVDAAAVLAAARAALESRPRGGISRWDASGVFQDLAVASAAAGAPSVRTLLLLYAADLAFRLRWQIRPALAEGRTVVAAPYVATAIAFGRAAGLSAAWLSNLFRFAPAPAERRIVPRSRRRRSEAASNGFIEFSCDRIVGVRTEAQQRRQLIAGTVEHLRRSSRSSKSHVPSRKP
jgi:hypothetical protein